MSCSSCGFSPCQCCGGSFTVLQGAAIDRTLVRSLTPCVDAIRDIYTCLGARAYQVALIVTRWSGGERGEGVEELISHKLLLPTPQIEDLSGLDTQIVAIGQEEDGTVTVSQISPRFSEDELMGRELDGTPIPSDHSFYWEIHFPTASGDGVRRRFTPAAAPTYNPTAFEWRVTLARQSEDRLRNGDPRG